MALAASIAEELRAPAERRRELSRFLRRFLRHRAALVGFVIVFGIVAAGLIGPLVTPYDPIAVVIKDRNQAPNAAHWFGTDDFGRDILTRVVYGARISVQMSVAAVGIAVLIGGSLGLVAGYRGGWAETVIMRAMDVLMAFPDILLAIGLMAVLGAGTSNLVIALGVLYVPRFARLLRGMALALRDMEYVTAVRAAGGKESRILLRHLLPNSLSPLIVQSTTYFAYAILAEAALSFLGLGTPPPAPSWGNLLYDGRQFLMDAPWVAIFPGLAISVAVLGINMLGDGLRDLLDPRLRR